jgi:S-adenosylmethionine:tRNA-ribosyltransferase-isomerase (queuine synthetase)
VALSSRGSFIIPLYTARKNSPNFNSEKIFANTFYGTSFQAINERLFSTVFLKKKNSVEACTVGYRRH